MGTGEYAKIAHAPLSPSVTYIIKCFDKTAVKTVIII